MVDREFFVDDFLKVLSNVAESKVQTLEGLQLRCNTGREGTNGNITNVAEEVFNAYFFSFFGFDNGGSVHECFCCRGAILSFLVSATAQLRLDRPTRKAYVFNLFHRKVGIRGHADFLGLDVYDDKQWVGGVALKQFVDLEV